MKSKDVIKQLQEIDPSGETHVCLWGNSALMSFAKLPGYYDGSYAYINDDGKHVVSRSGDKIIAYDYDVDYWVEEHEGDIDKVLEQFVLKGLPDHNKERVMSQIEKACKEYNDFEEKSHKEFSFEIIKRLQDGWSVFTIDKQIVYVKDDKKEFFNLGSIKAINDSGLFEKDENNRWNLKPFNA